MANVNFFSPDGGITKYPLEDTEGRTMYEEEIHGVNLFNDSKIEVGKAWNGDTNANRARNIIPCEPNSEYIVSMNGTNGLDIVFFSVSASIPPASQTAITSFPYTIRTGASDRYITFGFNKTNIALSDVTALKIMLRKADIEDSTYRPYNPQAIQNQLNAQTGITGVRNLLENKATSQTINGVTFTVNADGSVIANGTATANIIDYFINKFTSDYFPYDTSKEYILSGCPAGGSSNGYKLDIVGESGIVFSVDDMGNGAKFQFPKVPTGTERFSVRIRIGNGTVCNNLVFKPMLRLASDPDDTYQPYVMTNKELTEEKINIADLKTVVSASSDFADFKTRIASL